MKLVKYETTSTHQVRVLVIPYTYCTQGCQATVQGLSDIQTVALSLSEAWPVRWYISLPVAPGHSRLLATNFPQLAPANGHLRLTFLLSRQSTLHCYMGSERLKAKTATKGLQTCRKVLDFIEQTDTRRLTDIRQLTDIKKLTDHSRLWIH